MITGWSPSVVAALLLIHWSAVFVQANSIFCDDADMCLSKRFLRFGRALSPDPYYRINRNFYRLGRGYQPYQDKRFLRFGRSQLPQDLDNSYSDLEPYSRKRRSSDSADQLKITHDHVRRSVDQSASGNRGSDDVSKSIKKRAVGDVNADSGDVVMDKRFMRFGRGFGAVDKDIGNRVNNDHYGVDGQVDKRFMRFGKRVIPVKRFMRFGRNSHHGIEAVDELLLTAPLGTAKRFMRFGKRKFVDEDGDDDDEDVDLDNVSVNEKAKMHKLGNEIASLASQIYKLRESGQMSGVERLYGLDKRFMRFGKREANSMAGLQKES